MWLATRISGPVNGTFFLPSIFQEKQILSNGLNVPKKSF
jgi:hypothetical protein